MLTTENKQNDVLVLLENSTPFLRYSSDRVSRKSSDHEWSECEPMPRSPDTGTSWSPSRKSFCIHYARAGLAVNFVFLSKHEGLGVILSLEGSAVFSSSLVLC